MKTRTEYRLIVGGVEVVTFKARKPAYRALDGIRAGLRRLGIENIYEQGVGVRIVRIRQLIGPLTSSNPEGKGEP